MEPRRRCRRHEADRGADGREDGIEHYPYLVVIPAVYSLWKEWEVARQPPSFLTRCGHRWSQM
jgi:hypothetical protein